MILPCLCMALKQGNLVVEVQLRGVLLVGLHSRWRLGAVTITLLRTETEDLGFLLIHLSIPY